MFFMTKNRVESVHLVPLILFHAKRTGKEQSVKRVSDAREGKERRKRREEKLTQKSRAGLGGIIIIIIMTESIHVSLTFTSILSLTLSLDFFSQQFSLHSLTP